MAKTTVTADSLIEGLVKRGKPQHIAEGIVLNLKDESGFNPSAVGDNGNAYGLAQWNGPRKRAYQKYANEKREGIRRRRYPARLPGLRSPDSTPEYNRRLMKAKTREEAAVYFLEDFERPAETHRIARRKAKYLGGLVPDGAFEGDVSWRMPQGSSGWHRQWHHELRRRTPPRWVACPSTEVGTVPQQSFVSDWEQEDAEKAVKGESYGVPRHDVRFGGRTDPGPEPCSDRWARRASPRTTHFMKKGFD